MQHDHALIKLTFDLLTHNPQGQGERQGLQVKLFAIMLLYASFLLIWYAYSEKLDFDPFDPTL